MEPRGLSKREAELEAELRALSGGSMRSEARSSEHAYGLGLPASRRPRQNHAGRPATPPQPPAPAAAAPYAPAAPPPFAEAAGVGAPSAEHSSPELGRPTALGAADVMRAYGSPGAAGDAAATYAKKAAALRAREFELEKSLRALSRYSATAELAREAYM